MEPHRGEQEPQLPGPSIWPIGFAAGVAVLLVGLIVNYKVIAPIGALIAIVFGFLWAREATRELRGRAAAPVEPETRTVLPHGTSSVPAQAGEAALPVMSAEEIERFPRSKFLEASTLGLGAVIGGLVTVPALGFMVVPSFVGQHTHTVDLGPLDRFQENQWMIASFFLDPAEGEVTRRTSYIRYNGLLHSEPSFTILSNRCAHLGCPVQPNGPSFDNRKKTFKGVKGNEVTLTPMLPAGGFGCPCHGGQYDPEGNRIAGPPVRALDRYEFSIRDGHLWLGRTFSVAHVDGAGKNARIKKYGVVGPGEHVSGVESWLYPVNPPHG